MEMKNAIIVLLIGLIKIIVSSTITEDYVSWKPNQTREECNVTLNSKVFTYSTKINRPLRFKITQNNPDQDCLLTAILPNSDEVVLNVSKNSDSKLQRKNYEIELKRQKSPDKLWLDVYSTNSDFEIRDGKFNVSENIVFGFPSPNEKNHELRKLIISSRTAQCSPGMVRGTVTIDGPFSLCLKYHNHWKHDVDNYLRYNRKEIIHISFKDEKMHFQYKYNRASTKDCRFDIKCSVKGGDTDKEYAITINTECPEDTNNALTILYIILAIVLAILFGIIVHAWQQRKRHAKSPKKIKKYEGRTHNFPEWTKEFYMPRGYIKIEDKLGEGAFGEVFKGRVQNISLSAYDGPHYVAVKIAITGAPGGYNELIKEGEVLSKLNFHYNIINFLAISTGTKEENYHLMLIFEYCAKGNLHHFLEVNKETKNIDIMQMVAWTYQIAKGMEFLCNNQIIHGDLATRNILLDTDLNVKVGDFGKAHRINYANIEVPIKGAQPMLWMAPEALQNHAVTLNSDKWSYGVTVWEIFSYGIAPYQDRVDYRGLLAVLKNGHRMEKPEKCPRRIYSEVIYPSWKEVPEERLEWSDLIKLLESLVDGDYLKKYQMLQKKSKKYYHDLSTSMVN